MVLIYKVNSFFKKYGCAEGKVVSYSYDGAEEKNSITLLPNGTDGFFLFPDTEYKEASFYIILECFNKDCHYYAKYKIPEDDFEQYDIKSTVKIKPSWEQYDYDVID